MSIACLDSQLSAVLRRDAFDELQRMTGFKNVFPIELIGCDNFNFKRAIMDNASKSSAVYAVVDASCGRSVEWHRFVSGDLDRFCAFARNFSQKPCICSVQFDMRKGIATVFFGRGRSLVFSLDGWHAVGVLTWEGVAR
jgi:hypothetical protein